LLGVKVLPHIHGLLARPIINAQHKRLCHKQNPFKKIFICA
jgi:hypothetical protein